MNDTDLIDALAGQHGDTAVIKELRRTVARDQAQRSYDSLFSPVNDSEFTVAERWLVAAFASRLTSPDDTAAYYADGARTQQPETAESVIAAAGVSAVPGPYGHYPEPGLAEENVDGLRWSAKVETFGSRLAAALSHTHLLVKRPREATGADHDRLLNAGWSADGIVTLSQLIAFIGFQQRVAAGLRVLAQEAAV